VVQNALGDVRLDLQARKARTAGSAQIVQSEGLDSPLFEPIQAAREPA